MTMKNKTDKLYQDNNLENREINLSNKIKNVFSVWDKNQSVIISQSLALTLLSCRF